MLAELGDQRIPVFIDFAQGSVQSGERAEIERQKEFLVKKESEKDAAKGDYDRDMASYKAALARNKKDEE